MKKKALVFALCIGMIFSGCGKEDEKNEGKGDSVPTPSVTEDGTTTPSGEKEGETVTEGEYWNPKGTVELGKYLGVEVDKIEVSITDEQVQEEIDYFLLNNADYEDVTDRDKVQEEDCVDIDYSLTVDGEIVDEDEGYKLELGNGEFDFEERLIGARIGDTIELETTIEDSFYNEYVGQTGTYRVTVNAIQKLVVPELTDGTVSDLTDYETVAEYRESVRESLEDEAELNSHDAQRKAAFEKIMEASVFSGLDEKDVQSYVDETISYYSYYANMWGIEVGELTEMYFGISYEEFVADVKKEAEYVVKQYLILDAVIAAEKIELTDQEYEEKLADYAEEYGYDDPQEAEEMLGKEEIRCSVLRDKAFEKIVDSLVIK